MENLLAAVIRAERRAAARQVMEAAREHDLAIARLEIALHGPNPFAIAPALRAVQATAEQLKGSAAKFVSSWRY